jgi:hypothetical protein
MRHNKRLSVLSRWFRDDRHKALCRPRGTLRFFTRLPTVETVGFLIPSRKAGLGPPKPSRPIHGLGKSALPAILAGGIIYEMKLRLRKPGRTVFPKVSPKKAGTTQPSMVQVDGIWIHQGAAEPGANWERALNDVREERMQTVLKP